MARLLIPFLALVSLAVAMPARAQSTSTSTNLSIGVTQSQTISSVTLANNSFTGGAASGTVVGAIDVTMSPTAPTFSGILSLSGADASRFQIVGSNLETNGAVPAGTYQINLVATQPGATGSPFTQVETITGNSPIVSTCPQGTAYADGCSGAPTGTPQHPSLFAAYGTRPPWNVAGVDYYVGSPTNMGLTDPTQPGNLPAGASYDASNGLVRVTGNNVTLNGYNFSSVKNGIYVEGVSNTNITNSYFYISGINIASGSTNTMIINNTIDGGAINGSSSGGYLIYNQGQGITVEYNWMYDAPEHFLSNVNGGPVIYSYNLLENGGWFAGLHLNYIEFYGGTYSGPQVEYNTMVQDVTPAGGEGFQMYASSISNGDIGHNTMITAPSGSNLAESYIVHAGSNNQYPQPATGTVHDNFIDPSGAYAAFYPGTTGFTYPNNIDLVTGGLFAPPNG